MDVTGMQAKLNEIAIETGMNQTDLLATLRGALAEMAADGIAAVELQSLAGADIAVTYVRRYMDRQRVLFNLYQTNSSFRADVQAEILESLTK